MVRRIASQFVRVGTHRLVGERLELRLLLVREETHAVVDAGEDILLAVVIQRLGVRCVEDGEVAAARLRAVVPLNVVENSEGVLETRHGRGRRGVEDVLVERCVVLPHVPLRCPNVPRIVPQVVRAVQIRHKTRVEENAFVFLLSHDRRELMALQRRDPLLELQVVPHAVAAIDKIRVAGQMPPLQELVEHLRPELLHMLHTLEGVVGAVDAGLERPRFCRHGEHHQVRHALDLLHLKKLPERPRGVVVDGCAQHNDAVRRAGGAVRQNVHCRKRLKAVKVSWYTSNEAISESRIEQKKKQN